MWDQATLRTTSHISAFTHPRTTNQVSIESLKSGDSRRKNRERPIQLRASKETYSEDTLSVAGLLSLLELGLAKQLPQRIKPTGTAPPPLSQ